MSAVFEKPNRFHTCGLSQSVQKVAEFGYSYSNGPFVARAVHHRGSGSKREDKRDSPFAQISQIPNMSYNEVKGLFSRRLCGWASGRV